MEQAHRAVFGDGRYGEQIDLINSLVPKSITEYIEKRRLLTEFETAHQNYIHSGNSSWPQSTDISLEAIPLDYITCILNALCHDPALMVQELQRRGFTLKQIGQLMNLNKGIDSNDANKKRAIRILKSKEKNKK